MRLCSVALATAAEESAEEESAEEESPARPQPKSRRPLGQTALDVVLKRVNVTRVSRKDASMMYMGNCTEVLDHFKKKNKNKVSTANMRSYFKTKAGAKVWEGLDIGPLDGYEFDHIFPVSNGGYEYPYNYFVMPKALNNAPEFKYYGQEKEAYIGVNPKFAKDARNFEKWIRNRAANMINMAEFENERINM